MCQWTSHSWMHPQDVALAHLCSLSVPSPPPLLASCRELNVEPLKVFLLQSIFCIRYNRDYNNPVHLLISEFRLLLVSNSRCN